MHPSVVFEALAAATLWGISLTGWAASLAAAVGSYLLLSLGLRGLVHRAGRWAERTANRVDDAFVAVLAGTHQAVLAIAALLIGLSLLDLPPRWADRVDKAWLVLVAVQVGLWISRAIKLGLSHHAAVHADSGFRPESASSTLMGWSLSVALWTIVTLAVLSNLGVNITAFVASLGVGGIAVALAVQNILGDLFASLAIALDKPFEVGDAIAVNGVSGSVEHVGLKTTRIRALGGEQIVMANADLLKNVVSNFKRQAERRVVLKFGLSHGTHPDQAAAVPALVQRIVAAEPKLRFDRAHLAALGESSLDFEAVYTVLESNYQVHMDAQQSIILQLLRELASRGMSLAMPARAITLNRASIAGASGCAPSAS